MTALEAACHKIADAMDAIEKARPSRSVSIAKTKLDEALMWAQRGVREAAPGENAAGKEEA